ncbi:RNA methyltransferase [Ichthyobacterium seriolicida]|uniref:tRNA/rRNA methyltransferase n=1 Tax=Ichthyobacterium seriolicida TaxID=242600 RepID=A0A1J1E2W7_9FLAO|nr:RNA methyltransferase [Ichthyobacterium seriolicida]BAV94372.1 tRNA/rRNA methyltransferase [Ichthyobacterium seriolicida]
MRKLKNSELKRETVESFKSSEKIPLIIVLDNVRSANNVGSIFRTCDAFLVEKIYLCGITPVPPNRDIHKTALGATDSVEWEYKKDTVELIDELRRQNITAIAIEQVEDSLNLNQMKVIKDEKFAFIFGNEVRGVDQKVINVCDYCVEIPQYGTKHSLNVSISAGISIWNFFKDFSSHS